MTLNYGAAYKFSKNSKKDELILKHYAISKSFVVLMLNDFFNKSPTTKRLAIGKGDYHKKYLNENKIESQKRNSYSNVKQY